ncbi:MAG: hypothetical protein Q9227_008043 [Pyrenula ochraceoflavens]
MASLAVLAFASLATAQQIGTNTPEVHPSLPSQKCTLAGGCQTVNTSIVLDSQYRWLHNVGGYTSCQANGAFDPSICPDAVTCAQNCAVEGVDYSGYGIAVNGDAVTMNLFLNNNNVTTLASPRAYLLGEDGKKYEWFQLLNQEISYDVDVSQVPCGINGALYLSEMLQDGGLNNATNPAGAAYGTGYCDAQCPVTPFVVSDGTYEANLDSYGNCCSEMDLWEANSAATQLTPHPCDYNTSAPYLCSGDTCNTICDKAGCEYNPYRQGNPDYYGPGGTVDTTKPFTVVTQFVTSDNSTTGQLSEIRRLYVQNGTVIANAASKVSGLAPYDSLSDQYCTEQKAVFGDTSNTFAQEGGMAQFSRAIANGMVLVFSIWDDASGGMTWLDAYTGTGTNLGDKRGPCSIDSGNATMLQENYPNAQVVFSNIKSGEIGSTYGASAAARRTRSRIVRS